MAFCRGMAALLAAFLAGTSCTQGIYDREIKELDRTIERRAEYVGAYRDRIHALLESRDTASTPEARWNFVDRIYESERLYSIDSAAVYLSEMDHYARESGLDSLQVLTELARIRYLVALHKEEEGVGIWLAMKPGPGLETEYLRCGLSLWKARFRMARDAEDAARCHEILEEVRDRYFQTDSTSLFSKKIQAQDLIDADRPEEALPLLAETYEAAGPGSRDIAIAAYNIATAYRALGDMDQYRLWLVRSAIHDFELPALNYVSLYELALSLMPTDINRATRYIEISVEDALKGSQYQRIFNSGNAILLINRTARSVERQRSRLMVSFVVLLLGVALVLSVILFYIFRQARILSQMNEVVKSANARLLEMDRIKEGCLFRYMQLSTYYIGQVDVMKRSLRETAKKEGPEGVMSMLRTPSYADSEYKNFYHTFDETFSQIFPGFIRRVNELFPDEHQLERKKDGSFSTELRILAVMRLGMTDSGSIARFLNIAPNTIYTYKVRFRNIARCPKEEFEERVLHIDEG